MSSIGSGNGNSPAGSAPLGQAGSGIAAGETKQFGNAEVQADGSVLVEGKPVDVGTTEGAQALVGAVSSEDLASIKGMLLLKLVETSEGPILVPDDSFERADAGLEARRAGPLNVSEGDDVDKELGRLFENVGLADPRGTTTESQQQALKGDPNFQQATGAFTEYLSNPTQANLDGFKEYMQRIQAEQPHGNIMEVLFLVFKESIKQTNEDKKYFLQKLKMFNDMAESISDYLSYLVDESKDLGARAAGSKYPEMVMTAGPVTTKKFDLNTTDVDGKAAIISTDSKRLDRQGLNDEIKNVESMQETIRNKRQMASTAFQNFEQKNNQLYNMMSSVIKAMNEMRMGPTRNML